MPETPRSRQAKIRLTATAQARDAVRAFAAEHPRRPWFADDDEARVRRFERRRSGAESVQGLSEDFQAVTFLAEGHRVSDAVAFVTVGQPAPGAGTGFLMSPRLFITNQHVLPSAEAAANAVVSFNFQSDRDGLPLGMSRFRLDPSACYLASPEDDFDFAVVAVGQRCEGDEELATFGYCPLGAQDDKHALGMPVNIIQHPQQRPKCIAIRNNLLSGRTSDVLLYDTDTDVGSSGSPVFNDDWSVIALHHYGEPFRAKLGGLDLPSNANEGIRTSAIVRALTAMLDTLQPGARALVEEALALGRVGRPKVERRLIHHRESTSVAVITPPPSPTPGDIAVEHIDQTLQLHIPLEVTIRIGKNQAGPGLTVDAPVKRTLGHAERVDLDADYNNREGYKADFLGPVQAPLPVAKARLIAPLNEEAAGAAPGELRYEHFSVVMHRLRRLALFTATNIDGAAYVNIDRKTGQPSTSAEGGERWFKDPRIDARYTINQDFYSQWSHYFDRGHLTRRTDPAFGSDEEAVRANADTFHFTNCSPQHFRFNQSTKFWQGVERFVLEHGAIANRKRLCVFQGPVLNHRFADADDVQVPYEFWKLVMWVGANDTLRASAFKVSQEKLLDEERRGVSDRDKTDLRVAEFRIPVAALAKLTGLDFADLATADTFPKTVAIGAEAVRPIQAWEDLL